MLSWEVRRTDVENAIEIIITDDSDKETAKRNLWNLVEILTPYEWIYSKENYFEIGSFSNCITLLTTMAKDDIEPVLIHYNDMIGYFEGRWLTINDRKDRTGLSSKTPLADGSRCHNYLGRAIG